MIDREIGHRKSLAAVLASIPITCEEIPTVKTHAVVRLTIAAGDPDDPRRRHITAGRSDPVMFAKLILPLEIGDLQPGGDVECLVSTTIDRDDLGDLAEQEDKGLADGNDPYGRVAPVENQDGFVEC